MADSPPANAAPSVDPMQVMAAAMRLLAENPMFKVGEAEIRGNRYRVFENAPASLVGIFEAGAAHGERDFILFGDEKLSFAQTWRQALTFADGLRKTFGVGPGERVAIAMRNFPEWCVAYMGIIALGGVVVPLNAWWKTDELSFALEDCNAKIVIVDGRRLEYLRPVRTRLGLKLVLVRDEAEGADHLYTEVLSAGSPGEPNRSIAPDDDFAIYYTSGSTGRPKGVILTHRGAITTLFSWGFVASAIKEARGGIGLFGDKPGILLVVPLFHVTGTHAIFMLSYMVGRRMAMMPRWDATEAVAVINRHALTNFVGVPSQSYELIEAAADTPMPSLIDIGSGGAKRPAEHVRKLKDKFRNANPSSGYGLTETNAIGAVNSLDDYQKRPNSTGRPLPPCCDIKIVGEDGVDCAPNTVGEVWIRSAANFRGYLNLPEDTARSITSDGWFRTGDLGRFDDEGFLYIVDRIKDLIIRGGENISCLEVEARAYEHPAVAEAIAFSVPDEVLGERVGLAVLAASGSVIDPLALREFMLEGLAKFKTPERIWLSPAPFPRLGTAKFDKITIRKIALANPPSWSA